MFWERRPQAELRPFSPVWHKARGNPRDCLAAKGPKALLNMLNAVGGIRLNNNRHLKVEEEKIFEENKTLLGDGSLEQAKHTFQIKCLLPFSMGSHKNRAYND